MRVWPMARTMALVHGDWPEGLALDEAGQNSANTGLAKGVCKYCGKERVFQVLRQPEESGHPYRARIKQEE